MVEPELILIGYWSGERAPGWPSPEKFVDESWDPDTRDLIADYLRRGFVVRAYMGYSPCRICGRNNGDLLLSDGTFVWPDGLVHYVTDHAVRLPDKFVSHALEEISSYESADWEESWWRGQHG
jgi:hypothetical protein